MYLVFDWRRMRAEVRLVAGGGKKFVYGVLTNPEYLVWPVHGFIVDIVECYVNQWKKY